MKKGHWLILLIIAILIGVYFIARSYQPLEKDIRFFRADSSQIAKLEFISAEDTIKVSKQGKDWKLTYPLLWDVNEQHLAAFFGKVLPIKTSSTPMSEDPSLQTMYKVDSLSAIQVILRAVDGKILENVFIGNGTNTTFDYGRRQGDQKIYQFKDNITNLVSPDIFQWRSPNIFNLKRNQIKRIDVSYTNNSYSLLIVGDSIRYSDSRENFTIKPYNRAQYKIINALENLTTWQFIDQDTEQYLDDFKSPACTITIHLKDKQTRTLSLISRMEKGQALSQTVPEQNLLILLRLDDKPKTLYKMSADFINRFTRAAEHFKGEYD